MKIIASLVGLFALAAQVGVAPAAELFRDDFEAGVLGPQWSTSATNDGRVRVTGSGSPIGGSYHLVLDDAVQDANFSVAEATLSVNLRNKRNVFLTCKVKSLGNEPHYAPAGVFTTARAYDGVALSVDGGVTWVAVDAGAVASTGDGETRLLSLSLDAALATLSLPYSANTRLRFSCYDNASKGIDGLAFDEVTITGDDDQRLLLELPGSVVEGGNYSGYLFLTVAPTESVNVVLTSAASLGLPPTLQAAAGTTAVPFAFTVPVDPSSNVTRTVQVQASAEGASAAPVATVIVRKPQPLALSVSGPTSLFEGTSGQYTLTVDPAPTANEAIYLSSSRPADLTVPSQVVISAGQTQAFFTANAVDDLRIDGDVTATVFAQGISTTSAQVEVLTRDNEQRIVTLSLTSPVVEGATPSGTVSISGTLPNDLTVQLQASVPGQISLPASVVIPAGTTAQGFSAQIIDNALTDGTRSVTLTASAAGFTSGAVVVQIRDNDLGGFRFASVTDLLPVGAPYLVSFNATDIEGNVLPSYAGTVELALVSASGGVQSLGSVQVANSAFSGSVTLPAMTDPGLRLRARVGAIESYSTTFDPMRILPFAIGGAKWDEVRGELYVSVPSTDANNPNKVLSLNPKTLAVLRSVAVPSNPGQIEMTSGGEFLYVVQRGNGAIARIDTNTFTLTQSFAVGTSPSYGTLYAADIATVAGSPNLLVVSKFRTSVSPSHGGVSVYDNGTMLPNSTPDHTGANVIEPSADPTLFYGYNTESTEYGFRRLRVSATGITQIDVNGSLINGFNQDIRSAGDYVVSSSGVAVDGTGPRRLGVFGTGSGQGVAIDLASNRVLLLESNTSSFGAVNVITAYDPATQTSIRRLTMPSQTLGYGTSSQHFSRAGENRLIFRTENAFAVVYSDRLVPTAPPADLQVQIAANAAVATVGVPLVYTVSLSNQGPNSARSPQLSVRLSDGQTLQGATASIGQPAVSGSNVTLGLPELASGASVSLQITAMPSSAGTVSALASASSDSIDPNFANNSAFKLVGVGFVSGPNLVNVLRLTTNNLVYDRRRGVFWATVPASIEAPLGKTLLAIDPNTGLISDPIPLGATPMTRSMALSPNGRYLYVGLSDVPEVHRLDLLTNPPLATRLALGASQWGSANYAQDIEVLDGDGTSFLMAGSDDHAAAVYDNAVRRGNRTGIYTVDRVERATDASVFVGYLNYSSSFYTTRLGVTAAGVTALQSVSNLIGGYSVDIHGSGNLVLSSSGVLVDSRTLTLISNLGIAGRPVADALNNRAFLVSGSAFRAFDAVTGGAAGSIALPVATTGDWATSAARWGLDGFAVQGPDRLYLGRWSEISVGTDANGNGLPDAWELAHFGALGCDPSADTDGDGITNGLEFLFGSSPTKPSRSPASVQKIQRGGSSQIRVVFPRRAGLNRPAYEYERSSDLVQWTEVSEIVESVVGSEIVDGVTLETVEATLPVATETATFVRLRWQGL